MPTSLLIDTNLAVLFVVGTANKNFIAKHKRIASKYDAIDYEIVCGIIALSAGVIFPPNVLSETSNLIRYIAEPIRSEISFVFADIVRRAEERFVASREAVERQEHIRLGLTDAVLLMLASSGATLLTDDLDLYLAAQKVGLNAINYNHIREQQRLDFTI